MNLLIRANKKHICNIEFINVISKVIISKVFIGIVIASLTDNGHYKLVLR
jgi:hypothetical protein